MLKKGVYVVAGMLLLLGTTACGKEAATIEVATTQEQTVEITEAVTTEEKTTEEATQEEVVTEEETTEVVNEEEVTEMTTETATTEATVAETTQSDGAITPEEAEQLIVKALGTEDEETGNKYGFMHVNTMTVDGVEYHVFNWNWYVDGQMSHLTDLFVATDGSGIYEGMFVGDGATVYTETNYINE